VTIGTFINAALADWQSKGFVKTLKLPEFAKDGEECLELLNYIEQASPWLKHRGK